MERRYVRGMVGVVKEYKGRALERRVWEDTGLGIMICKEEDYQQALHDGTEPLAAGFPKESVGEIRPPSQAIRHASP